MKQAGCNLCGKQIYQKTEQGDWEVSSRKTFRPTVCYDGGKHEPRISSITEEE